MIPDEIAEYLNLLEQIIDDTNDTLNNIKPEDLL